MQAVSFPQGSQSPVVWWVAVNGYHQTCHYWLNPSGDPTFPLLPSSSPTSPNPHLEWLPKENLKGFAQRSPPWQTEVLILFAFSAFRASTGPQNDWLEKERHPTSTVHPPHPLCSDFPTTHLPFHHKLHQLLSHPPRCENNRKPDGKSKRTWLALESRSSHTDQSREDRKVNAGRSGWSPALDNKFLSLYWLNDLFAKQGCSPGYYRENKGLYTGWCVPCNCNGHSNRCQDGSGVCIVSKLMLECY